MFKDMSQYIQTKPVTPLNTSLLGVVQQPETLLKCASAKATQTLTAQDIVQQPMVFTEAQACYLPAEELANFFKLNVSMAHMKQKFTNDGMQKLLFHFYKTCERSDLRAFVKTELNKTQKDLWEGAMIRLIEWT
jgi:hypothetical protein